MKHTITYIVGFLTAGIILFAGITQAANPVTQVVNGGTGWGLPGGIQAHSILIGNGKNPLATTTAGNSGDVFTSNGAGADPTFQTPSAGGVSDPFTHPIVGSSATTSLMLFNGNASTTQFTTGGNTYLATSSGNVGIGTTSPFAKLSVAGNGFFNGNITGANLTATGTLNVAGQTTLATSLSGVLKATSGVISTGSNGTDYTLITAKTCNVGDFVSAVTAAGVFTCTTPAGGSGTGLGTTSPIFDSNVLTYSAKGAGSAYGTATSSLTVGTGLTNSGTIGSLVGGTTASISFAPIGANSLWVNGTGATAVPTVIATSSLGLAASITGTQGQNVIIGAAGIPVATSTIFTTTGSAVGINTLTPSAQFDVKGTTTDATAQSADFWNSASTNLLRIRNDGNIGIGSTSPWALLSVNANGIPLTSAQFSVGSSTATNLVVANNGFVGVGTSSPVSPLTIVAANPSNLSGLGLYSGASNRFTAFTIGRTAVEFTFAIAAGTNQFVMGAQAGDSLLQGNNNLFINTSALKTQTTGGVFGIGTTTPSALFSAQITPSTQSKIPFLIGSSTANFATSTLFVIDNKGLITSPALGTPAGTFLAADPSGNIIATTTPSGGAGTNFWTSLAGNIYNNTGARVQFPLFDATSTTGTSTITSSLAIGSGVQNTYLSVGTTSPAAGYARNYLADFTGNLNDFVSLNVNNNTSGACATADLTATNDVGSISANFADLGHTSSAFTGSGCVNNPFLGFGANSTYLFDPNGNMNFAIASTSDASFRFFTGGYATANQKMVLANSGNLGIGSTTPGSLLSIGNAGWNFYNNATSTKNGTGGINITDGCVALNGTCLQTFIQNATAYKSAANYATAAVLAGTPTYNNGTSGVGATLTEVGTGALSVDGASPSVGNRILVKNQADQTQNGVYTVTAAGSGIASYILTRATDFNTSNDIYAGVTVPILAGGTANGGTSWVETTTGTITVGTSNIVFAESSTGSSLLTGTQGQVAYFLGTNSAVGTSTLFITPAGNVGLGTITPTDVNANARLTVSGISSQDIIASTTDNTTLSDAIFRVYAPGSSLFLGSHGTNQVTTQYGITVGGWGEIGAVNSTFGTSNGLLIGTRTTAAPIVFGTNSLERLRIDSTGNIGIASSTPWALFSIASSTYNNTLNIPIVDISTSTDAQGQLFFITATNSILATLSTAITNTVADIGVRIAIGTTKYLGGNLLDQFTINGRVNTTGWNYLPCDAVGIPLSAGSTGSANNICGSWAYGENEPVSGVNISNPGASTGTGSSFARITGLGTVNNGGGIFAASNATGGGWLTAGTSTPVIEASIRFGNTTGSIMATTTTFVGFTSNSAGSPPVTAPTDGCYFTASSTQNNWRAIARTSSVETNVDTTVASTTNPALGIAGFQRFRVEMDNTHCAFYIQNTQNSNLVRVANIVTNIPSAGVNAGISSGNTGTATNFAPVLDFMRLRLWYRDMLPAR